MAARSGRDRPRVPLHPGDRLDLAADIGVHPGTLSGYLTGSQRPVIERALALLAHPLVANSGLSLEDVLGVDIPRSIRVWSDETAADVKAREEAA